MKTLDKTKGAAGARWGRKRGNEGMALLTVIILGIVLSLLGITLFAMATYERSQATYRDQSASAFWLAEAAIEHMKGEVMRQLLWTVGFDSIPKGEGWYNLSITDTTFDGRPAKYIYSQGFVPRKHGGYVERDIELFADLGPAAFEYALFGMGDINALGNPSVCGLIHANGDVNDGGSSFEQLDDSCRGGDDYISEGFHLYPPGMHTEPGYYPNTTYYYVVGNPLTPTTADIMRYDPAGPFLVRGVNNVNIPVNNDIDPNQLGAQLATVPATYTTTSGQQFVNCRFMSPAEIASVFDWETGTCKLDDVKNPPDQDVIVNFGEYLVGGPTFMTNLQFDDNPSYDSPIMSSVFNSRYIEANGDTTIAALTNTVNWRGGHNELSHVQFIPQNGIALLIHNIHDSGPALIEIGTPQFPAVFYITGSITGNFNANGNIYGTTVVLGVVDRISGNVNFHYEGGYQDDLPPYLQPFWQNPSGHVDVLLWREMPPKYGS